MVIAKAAQKVLDKADKPTAKKLNKALTNIQNNTGHIEPLKQIQRGIEDDLYRYKMEHYRIIFKRTPSELTIKSITTKSNTKFRRTGCMQYTGLQLSWLELAAHNRLVFRSNRNRPTNFLIRKGLSVKSWNIRWLAL